MRRKVIIFHTGKQELAGEQQCLVAKNEGRGTLHSIRSFWFSQRQCMFGVIIREDPIIIGHQWRNKQISEVSSVWVPSMRVYSMEVRLDSESQVKTSFVTFSFSWYMSQ